jgi:hypothetical protein
MEEKVNEKVKKKYCVKNCTKEHYGKRTITLTEEIYNLTEKIEVNICEECGTMLEQNHTCVINCDDRYYEMNRKCIYCDEDKYFINSSIKDCIEHSCPKFTKIINNNTCQYCGDSIFKDNDTCVKDCSFYKLGTFLEILNNESIKYCDECRDNQVFKDGNCTDVIDEEKTCGNNSYENTNKICKNCLCLNNNVCQGTYDQFKYNCSCLPENNSYGYNCEFYSEFDIYEHNLSIISLDYKNRLFQTKKNYFTYKISGENNIINEKDFIFEWKLYLDEEEITNNKTYEEYFPTATNEGIFGINKELFDYSINNNKKVSLSLSINSKNTDDSYSHIINISLINYEDLDQKEFSLVHPGDQHNKEMETIYNFKNLNSYTFNNLQYYFQYEFLDYYNERIPITPYSELENIKFSSPYLKGFYINVKNDRDVIKSYLIPLSETTTPLPSKNIKDIIMPYNSDTEKIYALISNFRGNKNNLINKEEDLNIIDEIIINHINNVINKNGSYNETNTNNYEIGEEDKNIITY